MRRLMIAAAFGLVLLAPAAVWAQGDPAPLPSPDDLGAFAAALFGAVQGKQWGYLVALAVIGLVFCCRKFAGRLPSPVGPALEEFFRSDPGGVVLAGVVSFAGALAASGASLSGAVLLLAFKTALVAMGGFSLINKLLIPLVQWILTKIFPSGKAQADAIDAEVRRQEAEAVAHPAGSASDDLETIK